MDLGIKQETLKSIEVNCLNDEACFTEMLSAWLHSAPHPSWEGLLAALEQPDVGYSELTVDLRAKMDLPNQPKNDRDQFKGSTLTQPESRSRQTTEARVSV